MECRHGTLDDLQKQCLVAEKGQGDYPQLGYIRYEKDTDSDRKKPVFYQFDLRDLAQNGCELLLMGETERQNLKEYAESVRETPLYSNDMHNAAGQVLFQLDNTILLCTPKGMGPFAQLQELKLEKEKAASRIQALTMEPEETCSTEQNCIKEYSRISEALHKLGIQLSSVTTQDDAVRKRLEETLAEFEILQHQFDETNTKYSNLLNQKQEESERRQSLEEQLDQSKKANIALTQKLQEEAAKNHKLSEENQHFKNLRKHDGSNTGIPTSQTPIGKKKYIPNCRVKSGKPVGGQPGHARARLEKPGEDVKADDTVRHDLEMDTCPDCGGAVTRTGYRSKLEKDVEIVVHLTEHLFEECQCEHCHRKFFVPIPNRLKEDIQYGPGVDELALVFRNVLNAPYNKIRTAICGLTDGACNPSEGYICKKQTDYSQLLEVFRKDAHAHLLSDPKVVVHWDDTDIRVNGKKCYLRFYGDAAGSVVLQFAHDKKDKKSIDDDAVLTGLPATATKMHDHNIINYNEDYGGQDIECIAHFLREVRKVGVDTDEEWLKELDETISSQIDKRRELKSEGIFRFPQGDLHTFFAKVRGCLDKGAAAIKGAEDAEKSEAATEQRRIRNRLLNYWIPFMYWAVDFALPTTNNLAERGLRPVKSFQKQTGQFKTLEHADNYAKMRTYLSTCAAHGKNAADAITELVEGHPYTMDRLLEDEGARLKSH